ncbi:MAG TPA: hypothetical protein VHK89_01645 [Actinomycetota bacterium]|nr:hypothetical protein [Actinomycetota bacterium]
MPLAHDPSPTVGPPLLWVGLLALVTIGVLAWLRARRSPRTSDAPEREALFAVAALTLGAAAVHALLIPASAREDALFGAAFVVFAAAQGAWGLSLLTRPSARVLRAAVWGNAAIAGIWLLSRTAGLPVGPEPWVPEAVAASDLVTAFFELAASVLGAALAGASPHLRRVGWRGVSPRSQAMAVLLGAAALAAVLGGG